MPKPGTPTPEIFPLCNKPFGAQKLPCQLPEKHAGRHSVRTEPEYREPHEYVNPRQLSERAKELAELNRGPCKGCKCDPLHPIHFNDSEIEARAMRKTAEKPDAAKLKLELAIAGIRALALEFFTAECPYCGAGRNDKPHRRYCPVLTAMQALVRFERRHDPTPGPALFNMPHAVIDEKANSR